MFQLCFEDADGEPVEPVKWIDYPENKIPLFSTEDEACIYLAENGIDIDHLSDHCYTLVDLENKPQSKQSGLERADCSCGSLTCLKPKEQSKNDG
jgi:hypothetical protein